MTVFFSDISCPGGETPCSDNGQCDLTIGVCNCNEGYQGNECSGKALFHLPLLHMFKYKQVFSYRVKIS